MKSKEQIKSFDFAQKPIKPTFMMSIAKTIICRPELKKRKAVIEKRNMEELEGKPYLLLVTHSSMIDFSLMLMATHPYPVNNVMTLEGFNTYTKPLMRSLGVLGKRKYVQDINLVRNIRYCLTKLKTIFCLFPEARYSLDGCTSFMSETLYGLIKMMKVPVVVLTIQGNFISCPQWNKIGKKNTVKAQMYPIISESETKTLSLDEIKERVTTAFEYDDFAWQYENKIKIDHPKRANGLHCLLYKCPNCGTEHNTDSEGIHLWCNSCGAKWEMTEYGRMKSLTEVKNTFEHIPDWSNWERECVRKEIEDGTYRFEDEVDIKTLPNWTRFYKHGKGKLIQTREGTFIEGKLYGEDSRIEKPPLSLESLHIEYDYLGGGDCVDISVPDDSYWCYLSKRDAITKLSFATEEIYLYAKKKAEATENKSND